MNYIIRDFSQEEFKDKKAYLQLPTPNLFAGGYNFHVKFEFIPVENMKKDFELIVKIIENMSAVKK